MKKNEYLIVERPEVPMSSLSEEEIKETELQQCLSCNCTAAGEDDWHTCPYQEDINNNHEFQCNCCEFCTTECAMDI